MEHLIDLFGSDCDNSGEIGAAVKDHLSLPPEIEEGNIEYKLKLLNPSSSRFEHLVTQMKWRLKEGSGEAIYEIGVSDDGILCGLSKNDIDCSLETLIKMADKLGATVNVIHRKTVAQKPEEKFIAEVLVRKVPEDQQFIDIRVAVLGNGEAGKSTLLGVLTQGELDNGRGKARLNLFRHLHEIQSGRTSSISHEILGFNLKGEAVDYSCSQLQSAEEICELSSKVITFIDLAGHKKYLRTTVFGLTAHCPEFAMLVVAGSSGVDDTTRLHYSYACALQLRTFFVVTKADICSAKDIKKTLEELKDLILSHKSVPLEVSKEHITKAAERFARNNAQPIFLVSSVTGSNLDMLKKFLNTLPPLLSEKEKEKQEQQNPEFQVDEIYSVPNVEGIVVGGILTKGILREGDRVCVFPGVQSSRILSIQRYRTPCRVVKAGQYATFALKQCDVRKGSVLLLPGISVRQDDACTCYQFTAHVSASDELKEGMQVSIFIGSAVQNGVILTKQTDDHGGFLVTFQFMRQPEYLQVGARLFYQEGPVKGTGVITSLDYCVSTPHHRTRKPSNSNII